MSSHNAQNVRNRYDTNRRIAQIDQFLMCLDWNRMAGRCDLPLDITRIIFDMAFGRGFLTYHDYTYAHLSRRLREVKSKIRHATNVHTQTECYNREYDLLTQLGELEEIVWRYSKYSCLWDNIKIPATP